MKSANRLCVANNFANGTGIRSLEKDILYCYNFYTEPLFRYGKQKKYWKN